MGVIGALGPLVGDFASLAMGSTLERSCSFSAGAGRVVPIGNKAGIVAGAARWAVGVLTSGTESETGEGTAMAETPVLLRASKAEVATRTREMENFNSGAIGEEDKESILLFFVVFVEMVKSAVLVVVEEQVRERVSRLDIYI